MGQNEPHQKRLLFTGRGAVGSHIFRAVADEKIGRLRADEGPACCAILEPVVFEPATIKILDLKRRGCA
jgi:hypothetical protein